MFVLLLSTLVFADDCDGIANLDATVSQIEAVITTNASRAKPGQLPAGTLNASQLEAWFKVKQQQGGTIADLFKALADGKTRTLPGQVVRDMLEKFGVDASSLPLPLDRLKSISSDGRTLDISFTGNQPIQIETPPSTVFYVRKGKLRKKTEDGTKLKVQPNIQFTLGPDGLAGVRKGDIKAYGGFLAGWVNIEITTQNRPGETAKYDGKYPVVETGADGRPVVENGRPKLATFDDWVVITGPFGYRSDVGVPVLEPGG